MRGKLQDLSELTTRRFYDLSEATALEAKSGKRNDELAKKMDGDKL